MLPGKRKKRKYTKCNRRNRKVTSSRSSKFSFFVRCAPRGFRTNPLTNTPNLTRPSDCSPIRRVALPLLGRRLCNPLRPTILPTGAAVQSNCRSREFRRHRHFRPILLRRCSAGKTPCATSPPLLDHCCSPFNHFSVAWRLHQRRVVHRRHAVLILHASSRRCHGTRR